MKPLIYSICFYFLLLAALPTVNVWRMHMAMNCRMECSKNSEIPTGCQKDKCLMNLNFDLGQFVPGQIQQLSFQNTFLEEKKKISFYKRFSPNKVFHTIWQPPELL